MRSAVASRRDVVILVLISGVYAALRVHAIWGKSPLVYPDSTMYRPPADGLPYTVVSLVGNAPRLWAVPLVYKALPNDVARVIFQLAASVGAWIALAAVVAGITARAGLR